MNAILAIAGADAAERTRRFAFLLTIVVALYGGYLYAPARSAPYATVIIDGYVGVYNSAWMGAVAAAMSSCFLMIVGFFLVRGSVDRDRELDVDGIVAATPVHKATFLLGKFASNFAVLVVLGCIMCAATLVMQLLRREDMHVDFGAYAFPLMFITLPSAALVSALSLLFDAIKPLRGVLGGVIYFFVWTWMMASPLQSQHDDLTMARFDPVGITVLTSQFKAGVLAVHPHPLSNDLIMGGAPMNAAIKTFVFNGLHWSGDLILHRLAWFLVALAIVALAVPFFDRFKRESAAPRASRFAGFDIARIVPNAPGLRLYRAELALLVNGANIWWMLGAIVLAVLTGALPIDNVTKFVLPVALIWPLERWSALGSRERRWNTADIITSVPHPVARPLLAQWAAGASLGMLISAGFIIRLAIAGDLTGLLACVVLMLAISACALACGVVTGSARPFEAVYLLAWYLGPVNQAPPLDFATAMLTSPVLLLGIAGALASVALGFAFAVRKIAR